MKFVVVFATRLSSWPLPRRERCPLDLPAGRGPALRRHAATHRVGGGFWRRITRQRWSRRKGKVGAGGSGRGGVRGSVALPGRAYQATARRPRCRVVPVPTRESCVIAEFYRGEGLLAERKRARSGRRKIGEVKKHAPGGAKHDRQRAPGPIGRRTRACGGRGRSDDAVATVAWSEVVCWGGEYYRERKGLVAPGVCLHSYRLCGVCFVRTGVVSRTLR